MKTQKTRKLNSMKNTSEGFVLCSDSLPGDSLDCEIKYEDGSIARGYYTDKYQCSEAGWWIDITDTIFEPEIDHGKIVEWRLLQPFQQTNKTNQPN